MLVHDVRDIASAFPKGRWADEDAENAFLEAAITLKALKMEDDEIVELLVGLYGAVADCYK